jgi:hypothetical protein
MNERIRELKLEAANWARQNHQAVDPQNLTMQEYEQRVLMMTDKFAELIVRECAGRVDHILRERQAGSGTMGDDIREHFGVEE